jgi:uroporphyrinogen decarboxylase
MNGCERILAAFRGEHTDAVPIMLHNFMMAAHEAGITMRQYREDPSAIARAFIQAVEEYGYDGVLVDVDTVTLAGAVGVPCDYPAGEPARVRGPLLTDLSAVGDLPDIQISTDRRVGVWLEAVRLLRNYFGDEIAVRGNCDQCPFTLAGMIRGMDSWMMDLLNPDREEEIRRLLEYSSGITVQFLRLMAAAGAHILSNGDSAAGPDLVSPALYRRFALPYERKTVEESHRVGLPYVLHICGNTGAILDGMLLTGADGLELDYKTDARLAHERMKHRAVFLGNIDPSGVLALGTPALVEQATHDLLMLFRDTPRFILNAGCAIPPLTPPHNLRAMIRRARSVRG